MNKTILTYDELSLSQQEAAQPAIEFISSLDALIRRAIPATIITERRYHADGMHVYWRIAINAKFMSERRDMELVVSMREIDKPDYHYHMYRQVISAWSEVAYISNR